MKITTTSTVCDRCKRTADTWGGAPLVPFVFGATGITQVTGGICPPCSALIVGVYRRTVPVPGDVV